MMFNVILTLVAAYAVSESQTDTQKIVSGAVLSAALSAAIRQANS